MGKGILIISALISFIVSIIINFNHASLLLFLIGSLLTAVILFGVAILIIKSIQNLKIRNLNKAILFGVFAIVILTPLMYFYLMNPGGGGHLAVIQPDVFRTNILTGQCNLGGGASYPVSAPWYYKFGCNAPLSEKISLLKKARYYESMVESCSTFCRKNDSAYCDINRQFLQIGISCDELITCDSIICR